jgi:hypothetical protein
MRRGRLALVGDVPELDYCTMYHCPGDCGQPHDQKQRAEYARAVLAEFDKQARPQRKAATDKRSEVQRAARNKL